MKKAAQKKSKVNAFKKEKAFVVKIEPQENPKRAVGRRKKQSLPKK